MSADFYVVSRNGVFLTNKWRTTNLTVTCDGTYMIIEYNTPCYVLDNIISNFTIMNYVGIGDETFALSPAFFNTFLADDIKDMFMKEIITPWCIEFRDNYYKAMLLPLPPELCRMVYLHLSCPPHT